MENATPFQDLAESITDPRQQARVMQPLDEILIPVLCGVVSGCEGFVDIALHGQEKLEFLRRPAPFRNGIPSHDTLSAVFRALDPRESGVAFPGGRPGWPDGRVEGATIAIDGRTARGSATGGETPLHMISAWFGDRCIVLGRQVCRHGRNEITDIPELPPPAALAARKGISLSPCSPCPVQTMSCPQVAAGRSSTAAFSFRIGGEHIRTTVGAERTTAPPTSPSSGTRR